MWVGAVHSELKHIADPHHARHMGQSWTKKSRSTTKASIGFRPLAAVVRGCELYLRRGGARVPPQAGRAEGGDPVQLEQRA